MVLMMMIAVASEAGLTPSDDDALWLPYPKVPLAQDCDYGRKERGERERVTLRES